MGFGISTILHGVLAFFIIIELGLTGYSKCPSARRTARSRLGR